MNVEMTSAPSKKNQDLIKDLTFKVTDFIEQIKYITSTKNLNTLDQIKELRTNWKAIKSQYSIKYNRVEKKYENSSGTIKSEFDTLLQKIGSSKKIESNKLDNANENEQLEIQAAIQKLKKREAEVKNLQEMLNKEYISAERVYSEKIHSAMVKLKKNNIKTKINSAEGVNLNRPLLAFTKKNTTIEQKVEILKSLSETIQTKKNEIKNYLTQSTIAFNNNNGYKNVKKGTNENIATNVKMLESIIKGKEIVLQEIIKGLNVLTKEQIAVLKSRVDTDRDELVKLKNSIVVKFGPITNNFTLKTSNFKTKKNQLLESIQNLLGKVNSGKNVGKSANVVTSLNAFTGSEIVSEGLLAPNAVISKSNNNENAKAKLNANILKAQENANAKAKLNANANALKALKPNLAVGNTVTYVGRNGKLRDKGKITDLFNEKGVQYAEIDKFKIPTTNIRRIINST